MNNSTTFAFVSVLLGLMLFIALMAVNEREESIEITKNDDDVIICFLHDCGRHTVSIEFDETITFENQQMSASTFIDHMGNHHDGCETISVFINASPELPSEVVIEFTNKIKEQAPLANIGWGNLEH